MFCIDLVLRTKVEIFFFSPPLLNCMFCLHMSVLPWNLHRVGPEYGWRQRQIQSIFNVWSQTLNGVTLNMCNKSKLKMDKLTCHNRYWQTSPVRGFRKVRIINGLLSLNFCCCFVSPATEMDSDAWRRCWGSSMLNLHYLIVIQGCWVLIHSLYQQFNLSISGVFSLN